MLYEFIFCIIFEIFPMRLVLPSLCSQGRRMMIKMMASNDVPLP